MLRHSAVAGQFYPENKRELERTLESLFASLEKPQFSKKALLGAVVPHAGYIYSGTIAARTVASCEIRETCIIIGPNHRGAGSPFSIMTQGQWETPLGRVEIDSELAECITKHSKNIVSDALAHKFEHSLEVILPFLQYVKKQVRFVPIMVSYTNIGTCKEVAHEIYDALSGLDMKESVSIIASSDMTHYESQESSNAKDQYAIEAILSLDAEKLLKRVEERNITMCGVIAAAIMIELVKLLGAKETDLIGYQTSGDATGDYSSVVGYAGIRIS